jgi:hypothetical protein
MPTIKIETAPVQCAKPINMHVLGSAASSLNSGFARLEDLYERAKALMNLQNAHRAYTMLHQRLSICCREHDTHIVDFELETTIAASTAGKFRFALPRKGTYPGEEVWLAFVATPGHSSFDYLSHEHQQDCPLRSPNNLDSFMNEEPVLKLSYVSQYEIQSLRAATMAATLVGQNLGQVTQYLIPSVFDEADIVCLAKQLAIAVLKFNNTPWNSPCWSTNDVILFPDTQQTNLSLRRPHFRVELAAVTRKEAEIHGTRIRSVMFCLGVVLYELWKYYPPFDLCDIFYPDLEHLKRLQSEDLKQEYSREVSVAILNRATKWLEVGRVDSGYFDIIKWCLSAPESSARELDDPQLLISLYEKLVGRLESVENEYKASTQSKRRALFGG